MFHAMLGELVLVPVAVDISVITVALVAIALLLGIELIAWAVEQLTSPVADVPVLGALNNAAGWLRNAVGGGVNWLWQNANPVHVVAATWGWLQQAVFTPMVHGLEQSYNAAARIVTQDIPRGVQAAVDIARAYVSIVDSYIQELRAELLADLYADVAQLQSDIAATVSFAEWAVGRAEDFTKSEIARITADSAAALAAEGALLSAAQAELFHELQSEIGAAESALKLAIAAAEAEAVDIATGNMRTVVMPLEADVSAALGGVAAISATLAWAIPMVRTLEQEWTDYRDNCGMKLCNNLGSLADMFGQLGSEVELAALFALAAELIQHPDAVTGIIRDVIVPPITDVVDVVARAA